MLYKLYLLSDHYSFFNIFRYISFRSLCAALTAFIIGFSLMPIYIKYLNEKAKAFQPLREIGPDHKTKTGTPTMGGLMIIFSILISSLLWCDLNNHYYWIVLFCTISFGLLGFIDDFSKIKKRNSAGISGKFKLLFQFIVISIVWFLIEYFAEHSNLRSVSIPFFKNYFIDLGIFYIVFVFLVISGASNAVNLTDGLDGLVSLPIIISISCFGLISYLVGNFKFANYLQITFISNSSELAVYSSSIVGSVMAFLWYNAYPAKIFMGDTGSLSLGGALGTISVITKCEILLAIIGGIFVIEAISVMIQVYYFKFTNGKRIFKMAPIHHHFEKSGWSEMQVVVRFWILSIIFAIIGLSTLKVR